MGYPCFFLRLSRPLANLHARTEAHQPLSLGPAAEVRAVCSRHFPGLKWDTELAGLARFGPDGAIEFSLAGGAAPASLTLEVHFGEGWDASAFDARVARVEAETGWRLYQEDGTPLLGDGG
jgi:hypothetical protein